jgi:F-type H+-transporting ATPase subunit delta
MKTNRQTKREAKQIFRLCFVNGVLDEARVRKVVKQVVAAKRRNGFALLSHFLHLVQLDTAQHKALVESALPLPENVRSTIQARLERIYGPAIRVSFAHSPKLIGGVKIKIGSDLYDGSIQGRLNALEKSFETLV